MIINRFFYAPPAPVYTVSTFAPSLVAKAGSDAAASNYLSTVAAYNNGSFNGGGADDTAFNSAYAPYVSTLPGGGFGRNGSGSDYLVWTPVLDGSKFAGTWNTGSHTGSNPVVFFNNYGGGSNLYIYGANVVAPISGLYTWAGGVSNNTCASVTLSPGSCFSYSGASVSQNAVVIPINGNLFSAVGVTGSSTASFSLLFSWHIVPTDTSTLTTNYPTSSRVNTVINNYAVKNEDNTYNYITNKPIFDEDTLVFYNPLTGVSFNVTGWYYDYSTRRYTLTYTDNSVSKTATVEYGYNYITVTADGAASNYYYLA